MGDHDRTQPSCEVRRRAERDPHPRQHDREPEVAHPARRVDVRHPEQHPLEAHGEHRAEAAEQATQHQAPEHQLLDDRRCDHRGDGGRHQVGAVGVAVGDRVDVAAERDVEHEHGRGQQDLDADRRGPRDRSPREVDPSKAPADSAEPPGPPASPDVPEPADRRAVRQQRRDGDVDHERPVASRQRLHDRLADDERHDQHGERADRDRDREVRMFLDLLEHEPVLPLCRSDGRHDRVVPADTVEVPQPASHGVGIPPGRGGGGRRKVFHQVRACRQVIACRRVHVA